MKINMDDLSPWPDIVQTFKRGRSLKVMVGGVEHTGEAEFTVDDDGTLVLAFPGKKLLRSRK